MKQKLFSPFQQQKVLMEEIDLVAEAHLSTRNVTKPLTKSHDLYLRKLRGGDKKSLSSSFGPEVQKKVSLIRRRLRFLGRLAAQKPRLRRIKLL